MNLGRSEYARLLKKEVRLKKAEILLEECFKEIKRVLKPVGKLCDS